MKKSKASAAPQVQLVVFTLQQVSKISVKGDDKHPLYRNLTDQSLFPGEVEWNTSRSI